MSNYLKVFHSVTLDLMSDWNVFTLASTMVTSIPNDCNCRAAVRPEIPEPTTITLGAFFTEKCIK